MLSVYEQIVLEGVKHGAVQLPGYFIPDAVVRVENNLWLNVCTPQADPKLKNHLPPPKLFQPDQSEVALPAIRARAYIAPRGRPSSPKTSVADKRRAATPDPVSPSKMPRVCFKFLSPVMLFDRGEKRNYLFTKLCSSYTGFERFYCVGLFCAGKFGDADCVDRDCIFESFSSAFGFFDSDIGNHFVCRDFVRYEFRRFSIGNFSSFLRETPSSVFYH